MLPEHVPWDYKIQIKEGMEPLPFNKIYTMSQDNLRTLKAHINKNISKGFLRESSLPHSSLAFFVDKPGGGQRLVINY